jgi:hypothetical protein
MDQAALDEDLEKLIEEALPSPPATRSTTAAPAAAGVSTADPPSTGAAEKAEDDYVANPSGSDNEEQHESSADARSTTSAVPSVLRLQNSCSSCKKSRAINRKCIHRVCASCCEKLFGDCGIKAHNLRRMKTVLAPIIADLKKAIDGDKAVSVWLKYATPSASAPRWYEAHSISWNPACPNSGIIMKHNSVTLGREVDMNFKVARLHAVSFMQPN